MNSEQIIGKLVKTGKWDRVHADRCLRANFKCEYCGKDLLSSVENFKEWQEDHIVPKSKGGDNSDSNIAVSCRTCNVDVKSRWNPLDVVGGNPSREDLIAACRHYISVKRSDLLTEVLSFRKIIYS